MNGQRFAPDPASALKGTTVQQYRVLKNIGDAKRAYFPGEIVNASIFYNGEEGDGYDRAADLVRLKVIEPVNADTAPDVIQSRNDDLGAENARLRAELEELKASQTPAPEDELDLMPMKDLADRAASLGLSVPPSASKADVAALIRAKESEPAG